MNLTELLHAARIDGARATFDVGDDWLQGRSVFGGLQAAVGWRAMRTLIAADIPLRTLQMTFIAPIEQGEVSASARVLRAGKSATHVEARLHAGDETQAVMLCVFGSARESMVQRRPAAPAPVEKRVRIPFIAGVTPRFMQQFDVDLIAGAGPFSGKPVEKTAFDLSLHDPGPPTEAHLLVIADFVPPVALSWMPKPVPGSSLTWMFEVLEPDFARQPLAGWRVESALVGARDGYTSQTTTVFAPDGTPVALSRQSMVVFG